MNKRRGDTETRRHGDEETRGHGDTGTRRRGDAGTRRHGDTGTRGHGDAGTRRRAREDAHSFAPRLRVPVSPCLRVFHPSSLLKRHDRLQWPRSAQS
jgi:hypothetical protein